MNTILAQSARTVLPAALQPAQLAWLAAAVFVVSAGYGALMPLLPGWLKSMMPVASAADLTRHIGYLGGAYAADASMYVGVSLTAAGIGLILPVIAYLAASVPPHKLGNVMGSLAAAAGIGQSLGSSAGGWLFGSVQQHSFGWLAAPLGVLLMLVLVLALPRWGSAIPATAVMPSAPVGLPARSDVL